MTDLLLDWLQRHRDFALLMVPVAAFAEACVGIGLVFSSAILVVVGTVLVSNDLAPLWLILPLAFAGAVAGDHAGFYAGRWLGPRFHGTALARRQQERLASAERLIRRHGAWTIFIGRFLPAIRSLVPALLGMSGFARQRYSLLDVAACLLWVAGLGLILMGTDQVFGSRG